jgi:hypothetical protein
MTVLRDPEEVVTTLQILTRILVFILRGMGSTCCVKYWKALI